jgi:glycosyl transferase family 61
MEFREFYRHRMFGPYRTGPRPTSLRVIEPELTIVEDAYATPRRLGPDRTLSGALYDAAGQAVGQSVRSGPRHQHMVDAAPERAPEEIEAETVIYLGPLMRHFGHFMLEILPRLWVFDVQPAPRVYFHPFRQKQPIPKFLSDTLELVAGGPVDIRLIEQPTLFSRVIAPSPTFELNRAGSPAFWAWCQAFAAKAAPEPKGPEKVYYSRSRLHETKRMTVNEAGLEALFASRGFEIVHPQTLGFFEQLAMMRGCRLLAGCSGSAMHQALFMPRNSAVVEFDSRFTGSQHSIEAMGGHTGLHFAALEDLPSGDVRFDESYLPLIEAQLDELLSDWPQRLTTPFKPPSKRYVAGGWAD